MTENKWVKKFSSFAEAEIFNRNYYAGMTPTQRLETMQFLRDIYYKFTGQKHETGKRLRRIIKVIKQT